jgi:hypothetical protein
VALTSERPVARPPERAKPSNSFVAPASCLPYPRKHIAGGVVCGCAGPKSAGGQTCGLAASIGADVTLANASDAESNPKKQNAQDKKIHFEISAIRNSR